MTSELKIPGVSTESPTVAIFSSFRQGRMQLVRSAITEFNEAGIRVTTPPNADPLDPNIDFVRFAGDDLDAPDHEIEEGILRTAMASDAIWMLCHEGYVGRTAAYEIGRVMSANAPLYFSERPTSEDRYLPWLSIGRIATVQVMAQMLHEGTVTPIPSLA
jgi:hypothetical protein